MENQGVQLKIKFPPHVYEALKKESETAGITKAALVRLAVSDRYFGGQRHPYHLTEKGKKANGK